MIRKDQKTAVIEANRTHETDTGSPEVQIAILTARIILNSRNSLRYILTFAFIYATS